jgi:hypothetical protein
VALAGRARRWALLRLFALARLLPLAWPFPLIIDKAESLGGVVRCPAGHPDRPALSLCTGPRTRTRGCGWPGSVEARLEWVLASGAVAAPGG